MGVMTDDADSRLAIAVKAFVSAMFIDGGDTVDLRLIAADGQMIAVLIPQKVFAELKAAVVSDAGKRSEA